MHIKKSLLKNKKLFKAVFFAYLGLMLFLTLSPVREIQPSFFKTFLFHGIDKVVHTGIFAVLVILYYLSYKPKFIYIIVLVAVIGILIEIFQKILPTGRSFEWLDWLFDLLGGGLGLITIYLYNQRKKNNKNVKVCN